MIQLLFLPTLSLSLSLSLHFTHFFNVVCAYCYAHSCQQQPSIRYSLAGTHADVPSVKFRETRSRLQFLSLTSSVEALGVLEVVRVECGRVGERRLFHTGAGKPLRLEEYDQAQLQATAQVIVYSHTSVIVEQCHVG